MRNILNFLYPARCPACRRVLENENIRIHPECGERFKLITGPRCFKCGRNMLDEGADICPECRKKNHSYDYGLSLYEYNETARLAMIDYKKNGWRANGDFFAEEIVKHLGRTIMKLEPEVLIPVPISKVRLSERGFNQSEYLARKIGESLNLETDSEILIRIGKKQQKNLSGRERVAASAHSFECQEEVPYKTVCIVDDVYTTGNTIEGCTRALKKAGVTQVGFLTVFSGDMY